MYAANWEGDAILEYALGLDDALAFSRVFASDPRLRHPEGIVFWRGRLRVCASYHSTIVALRSDGTVDDDRAIRLRTTEWCWGLAVDPATDRLLVSASPPYDFQTDLPGDNPSVARRGEVLEIEEDAGGPGAARHVVRSKIGGLTRPGGMAYAPRGHAAHAGDLFFTEYGQRGGAGKVLRYDAAADRLSVYVDLADLDIETPLELRNPWSLCFSGSGDALYVATDPNHRAVLVFDGGGTLTKMLSPSEAPNFVLCA